MVMIWRIISPGKINNDQGPDFSSARIKINGQGMVPEISELHVNSSDWLLHGHDEDDNYRYVILHVVWTNNVEANAIPLLELQPRVPSHLLKTYSHWMRIKATRFPVKKVYTRWKSIAFIPGFNG